MKIGKWASLLLAAAPLLAGCGNFWQPPSGGSGSGTSGNGGCTTDCTTATSGNFYILNSGAAPKIVGDSFVNGTLTSISGSPWAVQSAPYAMAMAPNGNFLIVSTISGVYAYPILGGKLQAATVVSTDQAYAIQVDATNSWLIEAIPGTSGVVVGVVPINPATGADNGSEITAQFAVANASLQQNQMVISPDNARIFIALGTGGTLVVPFNASHPLPSGTSAIPIPVLNASGGSALSVAVDPGSPPRLFYIGETLAASSNSTGGLRAIEYSSLGSTLTPGHWLPHRQRWTCAQVHPAHCHRRLCLCRRWDRRRLGRQHRRILHYGCRWPRLYHCGGQHCYGRLSTARHGRRRHRRIPAGSGFCRQPLLRFLHLRFHHPRPTGRTGHFHHRIRFRSHRRRTVKTVVRG